MARVGGYAPSPEVRAITAATIRAAALGALVVTLAIIAIEIFAGRTSVMEFAASVWGLVGIYAIAFVVGAVATGFALLLAGAAIARLSRAQIASPAGLVIAVASAVALSGLFGVGLSDHHDTRLWLALLALPYALPAAIMYRQEILLERAFDHVS